jgi:hypothetical protein
MIFSYYSGYNIHGLLHKFPLMQEPILCAVHKLSYLNSIFTTSCRLTIPTSLPSDNTGTRLI